MTYAGNDALLPLPKGTTIRESAEATRHAELFFSVEGRRTGPTTGCSRRLTASAALPLPGAAEPQRSASESQSKMVNQHQAFDTLSHHQMELIRSLVHAGVRFVVVGGYAVRCHGHSRPTEDLDLFLKRSSTNLAKLRAVLEVFDFDNLDQIVRHLSEPNKKIRCLWDNVEFFSSMGELDFSQVYAEKLVAVLSDNLAIPVMSKQHVIHTKRLALQAEDRSEKWDVDRRDLWVLERG